MKKLSLIIVLLWAANAHAGLFHHVIKPVGKAVAGASKATAKTVAGKTSKAADATAEATKGAAQTSKKAVKKAVV